MRYFKLIYDYENDDNYVFCDVANIGNMDKHIAVYGEKIAQWENVVFEYNAADECILTDYLANLYRWLAVSKKFIELTQSVIKEQVQYLPIKLVDNVTKIQNDSYYLANVVKVVDALDLEKSDYDVFELDSEKIISVKKYVLKQNAIEGNHIFKLKGDTIPVFVSEKIKKIIEDNNLSGFAFLEVSVS